VKKSHEVKTVNKFPEVTPRTTMLGGGRPLPTPGVATYFFLSILGCGTCCQLRCV